MSLWVLLIHPPLKLPCLALPGFWGSELRLWSLPTSTLWAVSLVSSFWWHWLTMQPPLPLCILKFVVGRVSPRLWVGQSSGEIKLLVGCESEHFKTKASCSGQFLTETCDHTEEINFNVSPTPKPLHCAELWHQHTQERGKLPRYFKMPPARWYRRIIFLKKIHRSSTHKCRLSYIQQAHRWKMSKKSVCLSGQGDKADG